ncbi:cellular morphogenesis protein [Diaporthe helianthi]|uniref:Cellular morphogenesis protein n=1 Tax=Diaporthe helianthi TaxID=158607 RepID=A0A2P5HPG0_DIAHE|nr:cellular morphogenesis protein [Diaporthe helianthi]
MRYFASRRRVAWQPRRGVYTLLTSFLTVYSLASVPTSRAINFTSAPDAFLDLDISALGRVGFAGDFAGISLYQFEGQDEDPFRTNGSEGLLARLPNGVLTTVVQADASIRSMCSYVVGGVAQGVVIAGNFTSLGDRESTGIALFNPNTTEVRQLPGIQGSVNAVLCDNDTVYVGGNFMGIENSTNAVSWSGIEAGFSALPFAGFNGPVLSITKASNGHIIFGGSFTGLGNASTPSTPDEQVINLSSAELSSGGSTAIQGFGEPSNVVCNTSGEDGAGNTWLLTDNTPGFWQAKMGFGYRPTKLRLYNTHQDGRGTKTWRFTALPINGIMNFTYIDPDTKQNLTCTSECPLGSNADLTFQEFHFVDVIGMNGFRIDISDWHGSGGGLNGIELFQDDIFAFAVSDFNEPTCAAISTASGSTQTGPWAVSSSFPNSSRYLTAQLSNPITTDAASVVFLPDLRESGYYTVNMYTPGCLQDNTCDSRGQVRLSGTMSPTNTNGTISTLLFQTNNFDKYDPIYYGYVDATSDSFRPAVTLTPAGGQTLSQQTIVAQKVGFVMYNTTGGLNGLFEYDPSVTNFNSSDFQESVFDKLGMNFSTGSAVNALATSGTVTFIGGNFTSPGSNNIVSVDRQDSSVLPLDGGLNGYVASMHANGTKLFVGGSFNNTQSNDASGLSNVAVFDTSTNTWSALGTGVNGPVSTVVPLTMNISGATEEVISFTGNFSQLNAFEGNEAVIANGFGVWVPARGNWLLNLDGPAEYLDGMLTTSVLEVAGSDPLYAGTVVSSTLRAVGAAGLSGSGPDFTLADFGARIQPGSTPSNPSALSHNILNGGASGVIDAAFLNTHDLNITVLAGRFSLAGSNGSTIHNVAIVNNSDEDATVTGFASGVSEDSTFVAVAIQDSQLFAGGNVTGLVSGTNVSGLVSFDLRANDYGPQPPALEGGSATVSTISIRPNSADVFVGGSFTSAGSLGCPAVCSFSPSSSQWSRPGNNLMGETRTMAWLTDKNLVAGGNFTVNGSTSFLVSYTAGAQSWESYPGGTDLPGPVDFVVSGSAKGEQVWVTGKAANGSLYLMKYDGSSWKSAGQPFEGGTDIQSLQIFSLTDTKGSSELLDGKMSLMLTGHIVIPGFGSSSAALFNGTTLTPFALTTKAGNTAGTISRVFVEKKDFFRGQRDGGLPIYAIVLIGLAIALGLTLLIVVAGMAMERLRKKREGYQPAPTSMFDRGSGMQRIPPHELLESLGKGRPGAPHV